MIVSASRRTDIPAYYLPWLLRRLEAGSCVVANPFNAKQRRRVPLDPEAVDAFVFWTRAPGRLAAALPELERRGATRSVALVTVTGLGPELEPRAASLPAIREGLARLAEAYGGPHRVLWRFDPILLGPRDEPAHVLRRFAELAAAFEGLAARATCSFVDLYAKTRRRLAAEGGDYPLDPLLAEPEGLGAAPIRALVAGLVEIAREHRMSLGACAEPVDFAAEGAPAVPCIDPLWLAELFPERRFSAAKDPGQRPECRCVRAVDIGAHDSCVHGCVYCYAVRSQQAALANRARHDPEGESLLPLAP